MKRSDKFKLPMAEPGAYRLFLLLLAALLTDLLSHPARAQPLQCSHCGRFCVNTTCLLDGQPCHAPRPDSSLVSPTSEGKRHPALMNFEQFEISSGDLLSLAHEVFYSESSPFFQSFTPNAAIDLLQSQYPSPPQLQALLLNGNSIVSQQQAQDFIRDNIESLSFLINHYWVIAVHRSRHRAWSFIHLYSNDAHSFYIWMNGHGQAIALQAFEQALTLLSELTLSLEVNEIAIYHFSAAMPTSSQFAQGDFSMIMALSILGLPHPGSGSH